MMFLKEQGEIREATDSLESNETRNIHDEHPVIEFMEDELDLAFPEGVASTSAPSVADIASPTWGSTTPGGPSKKRKRIDPNDKFMRDPSTALGAISNRMAQQAPEPHLKRSEQIFGDFIADRLQKISDITLKRET